MQIFFCLLYSMVLQTRAVTFSKDDVFGYGKINVKSATQTRLDKLQEMQDGVINELADVNATMTHMMEKIKALKAKDVTGSNSSSLEELKAKVESIAASQSRMVSQLSKTLTEGNDYKAKMESIAASQSQMASELSDTVKTVEENVKEVSLVKTNLAKVKSDGTETKKRLTSVTDTLDKVESALIELQTQATSCTDVKRCGHNKVAGEYWLFPKALGGKRVKVFCDGLDTEKPAEYISLHTPNKGEFPRVHNPYCKGETTVNFPAKNKKYIGTVSFNKIRINITTMEIVDNDTTHANVTGNPPKYASPADCYWAVAKKDRKCGPKGFFTVNTTDTGLRVNPDLEWEPTGWKATAVVDRSTDGHVIKLRCGGYRGGCEPKGGKIKLELSPYEVMSEARATYVKCPLY